ncbi:MAG: L,D-transpeptidase family protein [Rhodobacteraceae bacterium]|nr:L,D-transpeptidase family protein [Paracoccaceae bacterium]
MRRKTDRARRALSGAALSAALMVSLASPAVAQAVTLMKQAIAEAASDNDAVAAFYRQMNYEPIWTGDDADDIARRRALMETAASVGLHGLPTAKFDPAKLRRQMARVSTTRELGALEVSLSKFYLDLARGLQTGILVPSRIDDGLVRKVPLRDGAKTLTALANGDPRAVMRALVPQTGEYSRLLKEKMRLEALIRSGGWGKRVSAKKLEPGDNGTAVIALRDRLIRMGYLSRTVAASYDDALQEAVRQFQSHHGLTDDGVAGAATIKEVNVSAEDRLKSVVVAMERERWINRPLGDRHVKVNLTDFSARIFDDDKVTFKTRAVVGMNVYDRRTPEFSDIMEHMIINPSWHVPRSIIIKEYLPALQANPLAHGHLEITDARGRVVNRAAADFSQISAGTLNFNMRQPPGGRNALGLVKFMFPNKHNIYLHDTPQKHLFAREVRAYSHGCVRLNDPFDFAYALLAVQSDDPKGQFHRILDTRRETKVDLVTQVPVHLMYRTAFTQAKGKINFRRDIYGRDAAIWRALSNAGVALTSVRG